jgi:Protein of unknown function (DUF2510)
VTTEPGWYPDPYFLKRERYWDGGWTDQFRVLEEEQPAVDAADAEARLSTPSSNDPGTARGAAVSWGRHAAGDPPTASYPPVHPDDTGVVAATSAAAAAGGRPIVHADDTLAVPIARRPDDTATVPRQRTEDDTLVVPAVPRNEATTDGAPSEYNIVVGPQQFLEWDQSRAAQEEAAAERARGRHRGLVIGAAAFLVVPIVGVVAVIATSGGGGSGHPTTAAASGPAAQGSASAAPVTGVKTPSAAPSVQTAAHRSVAKQAAVVTITLVPASSTSSTSIASGSGAFVLANGLGHLTTSWPGATPEAQNFVFDRAFLYYNAASLPVPGKSWVVTSTNNPPALGPGGQLGDTISLMGNPGLLLNQLASAPLSVTSLGSSSIGAVSVERYQVSIASSPTVSSPAGFGAHTSEEVDVGSDHRVRRIVMTGPVVNVNGQQIQQNIVVAFSHYGKPTVVVTPPASQVLPISQDIAKPSPSLTAGNSGNG